MSVTPIPKLAFCASFAPPGWSLPTSVPSMYIIRVVPSYVLAIWCQLPSFSATGEVTNRSQKYQYVYTCVASSVRMAIVLPVLPYPPHPINPHAPPHAALIFTIIDIVYAEFPTGRLLGDPRSASPNELNKRPPPEAPSEVHPAPPTTYSDSPDTELRVRVDGLSNVHTATGAGAASTAISLDDSARS